MLTTCNQCHQATGHAFIRLQLPERPPFSGQAFAK
jgi:hypothetical protein